MPYIEWPEEDMKIRKNITIDASVFMTAWKFIRERDHNFSGLVNDLVKEWVEMKKEQENALPV